jgi:transcriptional regulator with XRE-family HTH domain
MVRRRRLAAELRRLREAAHLTCDEVGVRLDCSASKISRIETGHVLVSPRDVRDLLGIYGVPADQRDSLIQLARECRQKGWWQADGVSSVQPHLATYFELEHAASEMRIYKLSRVHGLLMTEDYARAVFDAARLGKVEPDPERSVELLLERQRQANASPASLRVVLDEAALLHQVGGPKVLRGQIEHLIELSALPHVCVQLMPFTASMHTSMDASFTIMGFPDPSDTDVVSIGYPTGMLWVEDSIEVDLYNALFRSMQQAALPSEDSVAFMSSLLMDL